MPSKLASRPKHFETYLKLLEMEHLSKSQKGVETAVTVLKSLGERIGYERLRRNEACLTLIAIKTIFSGKRGEIRTKILKKDMLKLFGLDSHRQPLDLWELYFTGLHQRNRAARCADLPPCNTQQGSSPPRGEAGESERGGGP